MVSDVDVEQLAREKGAVKREPRKFSCTTLVHAALEVAQNGTLTLTNLAVQLSLCVHQKITKQAVHKRLTRALCTLMRTLVSIALTRLYKRAGMPDTEIFNSFRRVLLQDSTTVSLPAHMSDMFPGASNSSNKKQAALKFQTTFDLKYDHYVQVELNSFTRNDQAASRDILPFLQAGDLVIRDLGYFSVSVFCSIARRDAYFLSRFKNGTTLIDPYSGQALNLLQLLKKEGELDRDVLLTDSGRLPVRLIARKVPAHVAEERRRKARSDRDKRSSPSRNRLDLLDWEIFITNVPRAAWNADTVAQVYGFRWRVEILFRIWKSYLNLTDIPQHLSRYQVLCLALCRILYAIGFHSSMWQVVKHTVDRHGGQASLIKTFKLFTGPSKRNLAQLSASDPALFTELVLEYCTYEKRSRLSFADAIEHFDDSCAWAVDGDIGNNNSSNTVVPMS